MMRQPLARSTRNPKLLLPSMLFLVALTGSGEALSGAPIFVEVASDEVLEVRFVVPTYQNRVPDQLHLSSINVRFDLPGLVTTELINGEHLLGIDSREANSCTNCIWTPVPLAFFKSRSTDFDFRSPVPVLFDSIANGTIEGLFRVRADSPWRVDLDGVQVILSKAPGSGIYHSSGPDRIIESVEIVPEPSGFVLGISALVALMFRLRSSPTPGSVASSASARRRISSTRISTSKRTTRCVRGRPFRKQSSASK